MPRPLRYVPTMTLAWHFLDSTVKRPQGILRNRRIAPPDGEWLEFKGKVKICHSGLHASEKIMDALRYAPGHILCRVECDEVEAREADKLVCRRRKILWRIDAQAVLRAFARRCALDVSHLWDPPAVVIDWLKYGREEDREKASLAANLVVDTAASTIIRQTAICAIYATNRYRNILYASRWVLDNIAKYASGIRLEPVLSRMTIQAYLGKTHWNFRVPKRLALAMKTKNNTKNKTAAPKSRSN